MVSMVDMVAMVAMVDMEYTEPLSAALWGLESGV